MSDVLIAQIKIPESFVKSLEKVYTPEGMTTDEYNDWTLECFKVWVETQIDVWPIAFEISMDHMEEDFEEIARNVVAEVGVPDWKIDERNEV